MVPLASIVMSDLRAGKGEHYDFDDNGDVEDKSVDDRIICLPHQGETEQQQGEIEIAKEKAKQRIHIKIKVSASR